MLLVDAGPLVAAAATRDRNHARCVELLTSEPGPLVVPALVITEVAYLLGERIGPHAEAAFARSIAQEEFVVEPPDPTDWPRIAELTETYSDLPLGLVDASVITAAERFGAIRIATLDHRHFTVVRPRHVASFTLVP